MTVKITIDNFDELSKGDKPLLVDFWAPWCGPCRMIAPVLEELATEYNGKLVIGKINVDEEGELAEKYGVQSIPMLSVFKDGKLVKTTIGFRGKETIVELIKSVL